MHFARHRQQPRPLAEPMRQLFGDIIEDGRQSATRRLEDGRHVFGLFDERAQIIERFGGRFCRRRSLQCAGATAKRASIEMRLGSREATAGGIM